MSQPVILILYYSREGSTANLARLVARGVEAGGGHARLRTVASLGDSEPAPDKGPPLLEPDDWRDCDGVILGSPTRFGNMAAPLKQAIDQTGSLWASATLAGKPAAVFTSTSSLHGGQESTLLSMMLPLLHHGMVLVGVPYSEAALHRTTSGGTPYGASHLASDDAGNRLTSDEKSVAMALGSRVADIARKLKTE